MACTRKKQCLYGDICPTARSDEYNLIDASCYKPLEQTNEEWLRSATFEEIAVTLYERYTLGYTGGKNGVKMRSITEIVEWLKEKREVPE